MPNETLLLDLAKKWCQLRPEDALRILRAVQVVQSGNPHYVGESTWEVQGSSGKTYYVGAFPERRVSTCTCPDFQQGHKCKHIWACALVYMLQKRP